MSKTRWGIALAAVVAGAALTSGIALAALKESSKKMTVEPDANRSVTANCAARRDSVSGGFATPGFDGFDLTGGPKIFTFSSRRKGDGGWHVAGGNDSPDHPGTLIAFAYCAKHAPNLKVESESQPVGPDEAVQSATARCHRGREAVSGGFASSPLVLGGASGPEVVPFVSKRGSAKTWTARAINEGDQPGVLTAFAYCQRHGPGLKTRSRSTSVPRAATKSATAKCPRGSEAFSGGFQSPIDLTPPTRLAVTIASGRLTARSWRAKGYGFGDANSPLKSFAYCKG